MGAHGTLAQSPKSKDPAWKRAEKPEGPGWGGAAAGEDASAVMMDTVRSVDSQVRASVPTLRARARVFVRTRVRLCVARISSERVSFIRPGLWRNRCGLTPRRRTNRG